MNTVELSLEQAAKHAGSAKDTCQKAFQTGRQLRRRTVRGDGKSSLLSVRGGLRLLFVEHHKNSMGRTRADKAFSVHSDRAVEVSAPFIAHFEWMRAWCEAHEFGLRRFMKESGNSGRVFVYGQSDEQAMYFIFPTDITAYLLEFGFEFLIKFE